MQENEFEKRVQKKMEEFTLLPREDVWDQVAARMKKERKRKPMFIWMLAGLLLLGGAGAWWYVSNESKPVARTSGNSSIVNKESGKENPLVAKPDTTSINEVPKKGIELLDKQPQDQQANVETPQTEVVSKRKGRNMNMADVPYSNARSQQKSSPVKRTESHAVKQSATHEVNGGMANETNDRIKKGTKQPVANPVNKETMNEPNVRIPNEATRELPLHKYYKTPEDLARDSLQRSLAMKETNKAVQEALHLSQANAVNKATGKKSWKLGFSLYGGFSDNVSGIKLFSAKSLNSSSLNSPIYSSSTSGSASVPNLQPLQHKSAGSFAGGTYVKRQVSDRCDVSLGIGYQYFSTTSRVGNRINASRSFFDSATMKLNQVEATYGNGQTNRFTNKYHLIQLPIDVGYRLNRNAQKPITYSFGLVPAFLVSSQALYLNRGANVYYEDKHQFKTFLLLGQSSMMFTAVASSKFSVAIGPMFQYGFSSFSKQQTGTNQHLIFTGIKTNIVLK